MRPNRLVLLFTFLFIAGALMTTKSPAAYTNQDKDKGPGDMGVLDMISVIKKSFFDKSERIPKARLPEVTPDLKAFLEPSEVMKFIWFGHSTLLLNVDSHIILIDPVFHNAGPLSFLIPRFQPPVVKLKELPQVHTIVISHDHYDHLDEKAIKFFKDKTTRFLVPKGVGAHLRDWGIPDSRITELGWNESAVDHDVIFRAVPAQHFSGRSLFDRNETLWASWIIEGKKEKIYYSGDSGYGPHFKEIGEKYGPFDYAFIENGQYNTLWPDVHMQPEESLQALIDLDAEVFIPVHWGMFDLSLHHWSEPIVRTYTIAKNWDIPILTPRIGETVDGLNQPDSPWWEEVAKATVKGTVPDRHIVIPEFATK